MTYFHGIALEACACFTQQFRGQGEVTLSGGNATVAEIRRQLRQQTLHICAAAVPRYKPVNRKGMALIPLAQ